MTIWDCFDVSKFDKKMDDDLGTTRILTNSYKGLLIVNEISKVHACIEVNMQSALSDFNGIFSRVRYNPLKEQFVMDLNELPEIELFTKYFPNKIQNKLEKTVRVIMLKTGIYKYTLRILKKIKKRL